jgi:hypothetical protein
MQFIDSPVYRVEIVFLGKHPGSSDVIGSCGVLMRWVLTDPADYNRWIATARKNANARQHATAAKGMNRMDGVNADLLGRAVLRAGGRRGPKCNRRDGTRTQVR